MLMDESLSGTGVEVTDGNIVWWTSSGIRLIFLP
jgi:membrane-bound inhibitor of C-type lysozyme